MAGRACTTSDQLLQDEFGPKCSSHGVMARHEQEDSRNRPTYMSKSARQYTRAASQGDLTTQILRTSKHQGLTRVLLRGRKRREQTVHLDMPGLLSQDQTQQRVAKCQRASY